MNNKFILILALLMISSAVMAANNSPNNPPANNNAPVQQPSFDKNTVYYPNATVNSAIAKYKRGNYIGCIQELISLTINDPSNALAYYYMAMAYSQLGMEADAIDSYERVIALNSNQYLSEYATKGRDCLTGGPACTVVEAANGAVENVAETESDLDKFINAPYGNGLSDEMNSKVKEQKLNKFKQTINKKEVLPPDELQEIKDFDAKYNKKSEADTEESIKVAQVSDEEILQAVKTLKDAGLTLNLQSSDNPYAMMTQFQDPKMAEMSLLLGNNNNNNNNSMMNMLPFLMSQAQKGENIDPRFMQTMMMSSMMSDLNFSNNNNNNRY